MFLNDIIPKLRGLPAFQQLEAHSKNKTGQVAVHGLWGTSRALMAAALVHGPGRTVLMVTAKEEQAQRLAEDLESLLEEEDEGRVWWLPSWQILPYDPLFVAPETAEKRSLAFYHALEGRNCIFTASFEALSQRTLPPESFLENCLALKVGAKFPF